jgi:hypothetical protein
MRHPTPPPLFPTLPPDAFHPALPSGRADLICLARCSLWIALSLAATLRAHCSPAAPPHHTSDPMPPFPSFHACPCGAVPDIPAASRSPGFRRFSALCPFQASPSHLPRCTKLAARVKACKASTLPLSVRPKTRNEWLPGPSSTRLCTRLCAVQLPAAPAAPPHPPCTASDLCFLRAEWMGPLTACPVHCRPAVPLFSMPSY